ncbi:MAG: hypothetical protein AABX50_00980 [Nanoarchaeota archaeon]
MTETVTKINFRELQEGRLITLVGGAQPVIFEEIRDDQVSLILIDPVAGVMRKEYELARDGTIDNYDDWDSEFLEGEEAERYLKLITGAGK